MNQELVAIENKANKIGILPRKYCKKEE